MQGRGLPGLVVHMGDDWQVRGLWGHLRTQVVRRTKMNAGGQEGEVSRGRRGREDEELTQEQNSEHARHRASSFWVFAVLFLLCNFHVLETNTNNDNLRI